MLGLFLLMNIFKEVKERFSFQSGWEAPIICHMSRVYLSATLNVVPFEEDCQELVRRGVYVNYRPTSKLLTIVV
jgi:hypothetical protein